MKRRLFHIFSCEARVAASHRVYLPGARILLLVWIADPEEEAALEKALKVAAAQNYEAVQVNSVKAVDPTQNQFQGNLAEAFQQMLELGWSVIAYPEPASSRH